MKRVIELTHRYEDGLYARQGHARLERRPKVDPDEIRSLPSGIAWVIRRGRAAKVAIERAPSRARRVAAAAEPLDRPATARRGGAAEGDLLPGRGGVSEWARTCSAPPVDD